MLHRCKKRSVKFKLKNLRKSMESYILGTFCLLFLKVTLYRNDARIAKICNLWTFWLVIQLMNHLFKIRHKAFLPNAP